MSPRSLHLREADRALFELVTEAAFANPFGARRKQLDAAISEGPDDDPRWSERMLARIGKRLSALALHELAAYSPEERALIEHTALFETFHHFVARLDALIAAQRTQTGPMRVTFAQEFRERLAERGLGRERAQHTLAVFFQMRRAFHFISRGLIGASPSMRRVREQLWQAVFTHDLRRYERQLWDRMEDFSTMLLGETGSGKGAAAAALGGSGFIPFDAHKSTFAYSFMEAFVPIHLNEFPETLFESEIFGHRKGSFTGAVENYEGALARCKPHGTVFFDEIGEATLPVQVKLLRVLQDRCYTPVGSRELQRFSGRIVAATHCSLTALRASGAMRDDFYYRLCSNVIELPTLSQRLDESEAELEVLVGHLCERIVGGPEPALAAEVVKIIRRDLGPKPEFPGNVRELEQCVRRVLVSGETKRGGDRAAPAAELTRALQSSQLTAAELLEQYCRVLHQRHDSYVEVARITGLDRRTVKKAVTRRR